ncbi:phospholipase A2 [Scaptodrosophila lebanonensis]|uniref:phospholipase A2 n=1 Tax=Drosophila lebanonensis TaxID=7225 RepID=A0A6J2TSJ5_DROLE|nr:phospholipase A2 [Scaptodrosophila lebanonensis]
MKLSNMVAKQYVYVMCVLVAGPILQLCTARQLPAIATATRYSSAELRHGSRDKASGGNNDDVVAPERVRRQVSDWFIAPNTRWCGRGNLANGTYNDLGGASLADKCCRKHDHCQLYIPAMSNRYELFNYRPYTLSHCSCDRRFRTCLKMAGDEDANTIGKLFFNMVQTHCFVLKSERVCQQRGTGDDANTCLQEKVRRKAYLKNNKKF